MKRAALVLGLISLMWLTGGCSGGSSNNDPEAGPLSIELFWAEPATGASPLRVTFTANITGGIAPYYYSWDYTNDGSVDTYINGEFRRTISVVNNYYYRASDPEVTIYNAVLKVTDSVGTEVTSDPLQVNVLGTTGFFLNPEQTGTWSDETIWDETSQSLIYVYHSGVPVYFRAAPVTGTPPYTYHWDFQADGTVDSTLASPQFIYTNSTGYNILYNYTLQVTDANGEKALWNGYVDVLPVDADPGSTTSPFDIVISADPEINDDGEINITFDPAGGLNVPTEPELDLAVIVNQNGGGGIPPFEYYWDFENDGSLDSQAISPSIPYYDSERMILINPYLHQEDTKSFVLRCMVIDSAGRVQSEEIPVNVTRWRGLDPIEIVAKYGIFEGDAFTSDPPVSYKEVIGRTSVTDVKFDFAVSGSSGDYEFQFDGDGDGNPDEVNVDLTGPESIPDGTPDTMVGGWYVMHAASHLDFTVQYQGVNYFPTAVSIRGVDTAGTAVSTETYNMPISLVAIDEIEPDDGELDRRRDHVMTANWTIQAHPNNGQMIAERELTIVGGRRGTSVLNTVQRIGQVYDPASATGEVETLNFTGVTDRSPINQERYGSAMWTQSPETGPGAAIRVHGGANVINGMLMSNEASTGGEGSVPWTVIGETLIPEYYKLMFMSGTFISGEGYYVMVGGMHQSTEEANPYVSRKLISYDPALDAYGDLGSMGTGRYDCSVAYTNGLIYVIGGREATGGTVATVEAFNPVTRSWLTFAPMMNEARSGAVCQVIGGKVYMIGGAYWPPNESVPILLDTAEVFNPVTGVWSYTLALPSDIFNMNANRMASVAVPGPGGVNATGGYLNSIVCYGGEGLDAVDDVSIGELNRIYELTYYHVVEVLVP